MNLQKTISPILFATILSSVLCFLLFDRKEIFAAQIGCLFSAMNLVVWHRLTEALVGCERPGLEMLSFLFCKSLIILAAATILFLTAPFFIKKVLVGFFLAFFLSFFSIVTFHWLRNV